jgi:hypothetical protein
MPESLSSKAAFHKIVKRSRTILFTHGFQKGFIILCSFDFVQQKLHAVNGRQGG